MGAIAKQGSAIGRVLAGRYRVEAVLGRGAMGSVYRAVDQENNRVCAIKLMHQFATLDDRAYLRFVHEAQIVAQLYHPNIVQVWGFDRDEDGTPIMAMEFLEGQDLHTYLSTESKIPLARVIEVVRAVGGALHAAHAAGVLHRDIKPKNIFLSHQKNSRGEELEIVKVVDFGLSKVLGMHHANETAPGTILGTAEYVAPESTLGMPEMIDFRADQWALGVVAYRMLSGRLPYEAADVITLLLTIRQAHHTPLRELVRDVPAHVVSAVDRAMAKNKEDRFDTVQDFLRALDGLPPVGHVLSMSSDGVPAVAPPEWAKRGAGSNPGLGFGVNSNSGRISLSGATHLPVSSASGRHAPSSASGRHAPSSPSGRFGASTSSGRFRQSSSGDSLEPHPAPASAPSATSGKKKPGAAGALEVTDELAALGAVFGSSPTPAAAPAPAPAPLPAGLQPLPPLHDAHKTGELYAVGAAMARQRAAAAEAAGAHAAVTAAGKGAAAGKVPDGSAEYSVHVNGHLVDSAGRAAASSGPGASGRPLWPKLLAPLMLVMVGGLIYLSVSHRATPQPPSPSPSPPEATLRPSPVPPAVPPAAPAVSAPAPPVAAPAAPPPAAPAAAAPPPAAAPPAVAVPRGKPGVPVRPQPGPGQGQWAKGGRPGAWKPGVAHPGVAPKPVPGAAAPRPPVAAASPSGDTASKPPATATAPAASPPKEGPKDGDAPHRISVVD